MKIKVAVTFEVIHVSGKFVNHEDLLDHLTAEVDDTLSGSVDGELDGIGPDGGSTYEIISISVEGDDR